MLKLHFFSSKKDVSVEEKSIILHFIHLLVTCYSREVYGLYLCQRNDFAGVHAFAYEASLVLFLKRKLVFRILLVASSALLFGVSSLEPHLFNNKPKFRVDSTTKFDISYHRVCCFGYCFYHICLLEPNCLVDNHLLVDVVAQSK